MAKNLQNIKLSECLFDGCMGSPQMSEDTVASLADLIKLGADVNYVDDFGNTPLIMAVVRNNLGLAKFLLENKADVNYMNTRIPKLCPNSPLIKTIKYGNIEMLKLLIDYGADRKLICPVTSMSPIHLIINHECDEIYKVFCRYIPQDEVTISGADAE